MTRLEYELQFEEFLDDALNELTPDQYEKLLDYIFVTVDQYMGDQMGDD